MELQRFDWIADGLQKEREESILLNTSFNLHGCPIVCGAEDALRVMKNLGLKYLALGNYLNTQGDLTWMTRKNYSQIFQIMKEKTECWERFK